MLNRTNKNMKNGAIDNQTESGDSERSISLMNLVLE